MKEKSGAILISDILFEAVLHSIWNVKKAVFITVRTEGKRVPLQKPKCVLMIYGLLNLI